MPRNGLNIGLRQAKRLCQIAHADRLDNLAKGLPIILSSAWSLWRSSRKLEKKAPREAAVLRVLAEEEAAKALVLMDAVRCPTRLVASRIGNIVGWLYDHLTRLIYAEAASWRPTNVLQLREYVDQQRKTHYLEGYAGEYIMPNWCLYTKESALYADIEVGEDEELRWSDPLRSVLGSGPSFGEALPPESLVHTDALEALGVFTPEGLRATSEIWGQVEFTDQVTRLDASELGRQLFTRLCREKLPRQYATERQASDLVYGWQMPMYDLEFSRLPVTMEELEAAREAELAWLIS